MSGAGSSVPGAARAAGQGSVAGAGAGDSPGAGAAGSRAPLEIDPDHPAFAGHFPGFPVLPGAVLLDEALHAIGRSRGLDLVQWRLASTKFLRLVRPGEVLVLEHSALDDGSIRFTIRAADQAVASGRLSHGV